MATIYIDNLVNPKSTFSTSSKRLDKKNTDSLPVYVDLHLDLTINKKIGVGLNTVRSNDIVVDTDTEAIRNSLYNIFTTKPGQKLLSPNFGSNLDQFLFEAITPVNAKIIGNAVFTSVKKFEPRVEVLKVQVQPNEDRNLYYVVFIYKLLNRNDERSFSIQIQSKEDITII